MRIFPKNERGLAFNFESEVFLRLWLATHFFIMFSGMVLWIGISFSKNFSCNTWSSKYYNW